MLTILLHSSKTMRPPASEALPYQQPVLLRQAELLAVHLQSMTPNEIMKSMQLSAPMADKTIQLTNTWTTQAPGSRPAIDAFLGDIYSGLQVPSLTTADRAFANKHLVILSGLYGALKALDSIHPYRLEMGYKLTSPYTNLYDFWGTVIADMLSSSTLIINLSAVEYTKAALLYVSNIPVISPKFLTVSPKTNQPTFVTVHAKIARGAFAHWLIKQRATTATKLSDFNELGYDFNPALSSPKQPVFICHDFGGIGMSVRLT